MDQLGSLIHFDPFAGILIHFQAMDQIIPAANPVNMRVFARSDPFDPFSRAFYIISSISSLTAKKSQISAGIGEKSYKKRNICIQLLKV